MKVFAAMYNPMTEESAHTVISLHLSKEGADRAILGHQEKERNKFENDAREAKSLGVDYIGEWDDFQDWCVNEMEVLP